MKRVCLFIAAAVCLSVSLPAFSHHSFAAEFDRERPITITGTVTKIEWTNPHARFYVDVQDENGETVHWNFELGTPNILMRRGWTRDSLKPGETITVTGFRARNDPNVGNANTVTLADGTRVLGGSSAEN